MQHLVSKECVRAPLRREQSTELERARRERWRGRERERERERGRGERGEGRGERERERLPLGGWRGRAGEIWCTKNCLGVRNGGLVHGETFVSKERLRA